MLKSRIDRASALAVILALPCLLISAAILVAAFWHSSDQAAVHSAARVASHPPRSKSGSANNNSASGTARETLATAPSPGRPQSAEPPQEPAPPPTPLPAAAPSPTVENGNQPDAQQVTVPPQPLVSAPLPPAKMAHLYDREAYSTLQELRTLIESQAWEEAAQHLTSPNFTQPAGVAPWILDASLLVSLPVAVRLAHAEYPQLRQALGEQYEALARLRVAEAIRSGDGRAIAMATLQFAGARAIAEAHHWLADQALLEGQFLEAADHYQAALVADGSLAAELAPRRQLGAALAGLGEVSVPAGEVRLGAVAESPARFAALLAEMRSRALALGSPRDQQSRLRLEDLPPRFDSRKCGQLADFFSANERASDPPPRLAVELVGTVGYLASPQHLAAYDFQTQRLLWRSEPLASQRVHGRNEKLPAARPLVHGDRVVARLLRDQGPRWCCFSAQTGSLLWMADARTSESLLAAPLVHNGQLLALFARNSGNANRVLHRCQLDWATGEVIAARPLLPLEGEVHPRDCLAMFHGTQLVALTGSTTIGIGPDGELLWVRGSAARDAATVPAAVATFGDTVMVSRPHDHVLECFDAATGRQRWLRDLGAPGRLAGVCGGVALIEIDQAILGLDPRHGNEIWRATTGEASAVLAVDDQSLLLLDASDPTANQLLWLAGSDGQVAAIAHLLGLSPTDRMERLIFFEKQRFALVRGDQEPALDIVELVPAAVAAESRFLQRPITMEFPLASPTFGLSAPCPRDRPSLD